MTEQNMKMFSIWFWVGLVLGIYGLIITGAGVYYIFNPETKTVLGQYNPSLWWGIIMLVASFIFLAITGFGKNKV